MRSIFLSLICIIIVSCGSNPSGTHTVTDEKYDPTDEELYAACAELKGVGQFIIGKTTFKQVLNDKDFKKVATTIYDRQSNMYNGHWGIDFWNKKGENHVLPGDPKVKWMKSKTGSRLKQLPSSPLTGITLGMLKFEPFDMAFLNDTLVAIFFYPDDKIEDKVIAHYKEKYGNGRGKLYSFDLTKSNSNSNLTVIQVIEEKHSWENETVALEYEKNESFHMEPNRSPYGNYKHSMMIYSKKRYPAYEEQLLKLSSDYDEMVKSSESQAINSL
ncbi:hypothetical protein SAMN06298215_0397 [Bacteroidales bacterium WCE2008]|nr:hypothetical protein SAMN06298215_0397 [Bacteroidales bacterium WCE2008]